jgi:hypothetical protein
MSTSETACCDFAHSNYVFNGSFNDIPTQCGNGCEIGAVRHVLWKAVRLRVRSGRSSKSMETSMLGAVVNILADSIKVHKLSPLPLQ